jgi:hypothetical protein
MPIKVAHANFVEFSGKMKEAYFFTFAFAFLSFFIWPVSPLIRVFSGLGSFAPYSILQP